MSNKDNQNKGPKFHGGSILFYLVVLGVIIFLGLNLFGDNTGTEKKTLSDVLYYIESDEYTVTEVNVTGTVVTMEAKDAEDKAVLIKQEIPAIYVDDFINELKDAKSSGKIENYSYIKPFDWDGVMSILTLVLTIGAVVVFFLIFLRQGSDTNVMSFTQNTAKLVSPNQSKIKFGDVAGCDEEKEELEEMVDFLKNPAKYKKMGAKIPKGVILSGPPGTGKTLLAKAVAGEANVPFFHMSGSDFVEMFVGVGASRVRSLFADAKKAAPSVIFIDEIDAVGRKRGSGLGGGHDEREQTLNAILVEMDGFDTNTNVIVMAATNREDVLDSALLRPGRFDRKIVVGEPDVKGREEILKIHAKGKPLSKDVDLKDVALNTAGFTGADLANLLNEAALLAARRNKKEITPLEVSDATYRVVMGPEKKSRKISEASKKLTAYHEAGHAVVLRATTDLEKVDRVTIIPVGRAGGFTSHKPVEDIDFYTKKMILDKIKMSLGGRAAEEIFLDDISTGASSDLQYCNSLAVKMIKRFGLSDKFKNMVFGDDNDEVFIGGSYGQVQSYSDKTAAEIDEEIQKIIDQCYQDTLQILEDKRNVVEGLVERLLEVNKVDGPEFEEIYLADGDLTSIRAKEAEMKEKYSAENVNKKEEKSEETSEDASEDASETTAEETNEAPEAEDASSKEDKPSEE